MVAGCAMAVMGKASAPGRTKTRLVPPLSADQAALLNTAFLRDIVGNLLAAKRNIDIAPYIAYGPSGSERFFQELFPSAVGLIDCSQPNFGDCLFQAVSALLKRGHAAACVLNADSPTLPTGYLVDAAHALAAPGDRVVLGPSADGGYYLLGLKQPHRQLFDGIEWSTPKVLAQTCERAAAMSLPVVMLEPWYDVDDAESLRRLRSDLHMPADHAGAPVLFPAPHTRTALSLYSSQAAT